jgi:hypothetical protein
MSRKSRILPIGVALMIFTGTGAMAQPRLGVCAADIKAYCTDVEPGEGRLAACIKEHVSDFSLTCKARLVRTIVTAKECASSLKEQCGGRQRNGSETRTCLRDSVASLSDLCKTVILGAVLRRR